MGVGVRTKVIFLGRDCVNPALRVSGWSGWEQRRGRHPEPGPWPTATPLRPSLSCPSLWPQEFEVIAQIKLLQSACNNYSIEPEEQFGAWFRATQRLSETER